MTAHRFPTSRRNTVRRQLLAWYARSGRTFPWRRTRDPYRILVSEVMLQQTQASRVAGAYRSFLRIFPDVRSLARATPGRVLRAWTGMGYNRRALWLHEAARTIAGRHGGRVPNSFDELTDLPGVGANSARGILCFAYDRRVAVLDVNVRRVLGRVLGIPQEAVTEAAADWFLPVRRAYDWNQAVMDLGATVCTARSPKCGACPVRKACSSAFAVAPAPARTMRTEPSRGGVPRRLIRGMVVRALQTGRTVTPRALCRLVLPRRSAGDAAWMERLVLQLASEGLVTVRRGGRTMRVSRAA